LVAWYLFSRRAGDGPVLLSGDLTPQSLAAAIEASAETLRLRAPRRRKSGGDAASTERS
jgi:hypothetical protein